MLACAIGLYRTLPRVAVRAVRERGNTAHCPAGDAPTAPIGAGRA
jgi:hypothetical protein